MKCSLQNTAFNNIVLLALVSELGVVIWQWNLTADAYAFGKASSMELLLFPMLTFLIVYAMAVTAYQRPQGDGLKDFVTKVYELS